MKIRSIAAALVLCAACVDEGSDSDQDMPTAVEPDKPQDPFEPDPGSSDPRDDFQPDSVDADLTCEIVPEPDDPQGPCAHACDPEGLKQFVPEGACFTFACHDKDGALRKVGACNVD